MIIDTEKITSREFILENVKLEPMNETRYERILGEIPKKQLLDLVFLFRVPICEDEGKETGYVVSNSIMEHLGISFEELEGAAIGNIFKAEYVVRPLGEVMADITGDESLAELDEIGEPIYMLTNEKGFKGSSALFRNDFLKKLADKVGGDLCVIPASIHEILAFKAGDRAASDIRQMIKYINDTTLEREEIIGYNAYQFSRDACILTIA